MLIPLTTICTLTWLPDRIVDQMANLIRSPKLGSNWTTNDLITYNITITAQSPQEFFHQNLEPPLLGVDPLLIDSAVNADNVTDDTFQYLTHLDLAINQGQVTDFAQETLHILSFAKQGPALSTHNMIPLMICEDDQFAQADVCLLDQQLMRILLILKEDKTVFNSSQLEPQVIAAVIAAYQHHNGTLFTRSLDAMTIPCITMDGMWPTFYLVPVTQELYSAVCTGQYPQTVTKVVKCVTVLGQDHPYGEGMETPAYRQLAFQRLVMFKDLAKEYWQTLLV